MMEFAQHKKRSLKAQVRPVALASSASSSSDSNKQTPTSVDQNIVVQSESMVVQKKSRVVLTEQLNHPKAS